MIDFRYHLISIVAVFLALGIGILMGSVVLDQRLVSNLEDQLRDIEQTNSDLRRANGELRRQVELDEQFALAARDLLLRDALEGSDVVLFTFAGTDGALLDSVRSGIAQAGGEIVTEMTATEKLALESEPEIDELALIVGSPASTPEEVRADAGRVLGDRAAAVARLEPLPAAEAEAPPPPEEPEEGRLESLLEDLRGAGFLDVDRSGETAVPRGALFLPADLIVPLTTSLAGPEVAVVAAESSTSTWNLAQILRTDDEAQQEVSTVDQAETTSGTIAVVLSLAEAAEGCSGRHYGVQSGVGGIIPRPLDEC
jgi:hypothetical protein